MFFKKFFLYSTSILSVSLAYNDLLYAPRRGLAEDDASSVASISFKMREVSDEEDPRVLALKEGLQQLEEDYEKLWSITQQFAVHIQRNQLEPRRLESRSRKSSLSSTPETSSSKTIKANPTDERRRKDALLQRKAVAEYDREQRENRLARQRKKEIRPSEDQENIDPVVLSTQIRREKSVPTLRTSNFQDASLATPKKKVTAKSNAPTFHEPFPTFYTLSSRDRMSNFGIYARKRNAY